MNLRWLWLDHFPPGLELTPAQRAEARKRARAHRRRDQSYRGSSRAVAKIAGVTSGILSLLFCGWLFLLVGRRLPPGQFVALNVLGILLFQSLTWVGISLAMNRSRAPYIRKALNDMDLPVCMECGYILRGIHEKQACPECGTTREIVPELNREAER